jgi:hypothetical protein
MDNDGETCPWCSRAHASNPCEDCKRGRVRIKNTIANDDGTEVSFDSWTDPAHWVSYRMTGTA